MDTVVKHTILSWGLQGLINVDVYNLQSVVTKGRGSGETEQDIEMCGNNKISYQTENQINVFLPFPLKDLGPFAQRYLITR